MSNQLRFTNDPGRFERRSDGLYIQRITGQEFGQLNKNFITTKDVWVAHSKDGEPIRPLVWGLSLALAVAQLCRHEGLAEIEVIHQSDQALGALGVTNPSHDDIQVARVVDELAELEKDAEEGAAQLEALQARCQELEAAVAAAEALLPDEPTHEADDVVAAAMAAHEVNRLYCLSLGDHSQPPWRDAPEWQRESAIAGARAIKDNPALTPKESHEAWSALKLATGWTYGITKDTEAKTHPCLVPYEQLPPEQQTKDTLFGAVVRGVLAHRGDIPFCPGSPEAPPRSACAEHERRGGDAETCPDDALEAAIEEAKSGIPF